MTILGGVGGSNGSIQSLFLRFPSCPSEDHPRFPGRGLTQMLLERIGHGRSVKYLMTISLRSIVLSGSPNGRFETLLSTSPAAQLGSFGARTA